MSTLQPDIVAAVRGQKKRLHKHDFPDLECFRKYQSLLRTFNMRRYRARKRAQLGVGKETPEMKLQRLMVAAAT